MKSSDKLLHEAFISFIKYYLSKYNNEKTIKRRKSRLDDAYESFLKGNLSRINEMNSIKPKRQGGLVASDWFASQKG